jgi:hypothetical protein
MSSRFRFAPLFLAIVGQAALADEVPDEPGPNYVPPPPVVAEPPAPPPAPPPAAAPPPVAPVAAIETPTRFHWWSYGEAHYKTFDNGEAHEERLHVHRIVAGAGYDLTDHTRAVGSLEWLFPISDRDEVSGVHIEQLYLETDLPADHYVRGGIVMLPVGTLNENHDPTKFYGVERNSIESEVIPTTWSAPGIMAGHTPRVSGLGYDVAVTGGIRTPPDGAPNAYRARNGIQPESEADLSSLAYTARLRYRLPVGVEVGTSYHHEDDVRQGEDAESVPANLVDVYVAGNAGPVSTRLVYARWMLDGDRVDFRDRAVQKGYYAEAGYRILPQVGVYTGYANWDIGGREGDSDLQSRSVGVNYWPIRQLVLKAEYKSDRGAHEHDGVVLGIGYSIP